MLRNIKFRLSALAVLLLATSCLDKYPESAIPEKDAMKTFADAEQTLTGIYATFKSSSLFSGRLTLLPDIQADLVYAVEGNSNQFGNFWRWDVRPTDLDLEGVYADLYTVISRCNFFLERIDEVMRNEISDDNLEELEELPVEFSATGAGRGYACAGGVASAIESCINEYFAGTEVKIQHAEGLSDCKKVLTLAKAGKLNGYLIEGMGCPGGCVAGVGTIIPPERAKFVVEQTVKASKEALPPKEMEDLAEKLNKMN